MRLKKNEAASQSRGETVCRDKKWYQNKQFTKGFPTENFRVRFQKKTKQQGRQEKGPYAGATHGSRISNLQKESQHNIFVCELKKPNSKAANMQITLATLTVNVQLYYYYYD